MSASTSYNVTRAALVADTQRLYSEAFLADPVTMSEATLVVTGSEVFTWSKLTVDQISRLRRVIYIVVLEARS